MRAVREEGEAEKVEAPPPPHLLPLLRLLVLVLVLSFPSSLSSSSCPCPCPCPCPAPSPLTACPRLGRVRSVAHVALVGSPLADTGTPRAVPVARARQDSAAAAQQPRAGPVGDCVARCTADRRRRRPGTDADRPRRPPLHYRPRAAAGMVAVSERTFRAHLRRLTAYPPPPAHPARIARPEPRPARLARPKPRPRPRSSGTPRPHSR